MSNSGSALLTGASKSQRIVLGRPHARRVLLHQALHTTQL